MCLHTCSKCEVLVFGSVRDISTYLQEEGIRVDFTVKTATRSDANKLKDTMTEDLARLQILELGAWMSWSAPGTMSGLVRTSILHAHTA